MAARTPKATVPRPHSDVLPPRADDVLMTPAAVDPVPAEEAPTETPAPVEGEPAPAPEPAAEAAPIEPPAPVVITFARPPPAIETELRGMVADGKDALAVFRYLRWRRADGAESGVEEAQDAVRWLVAQAPIVAKVIELVPAEGETYDRPALRSIPKPPPEAAPAPVVARIVPPPRQRITQVKEVDHAFELTDDERFQVGLKSVNLGLDIEGVKTRHSEERKRNREELAGMTAHRALLDDIFKRGAEVRKVRVAFVSDFELGITYMVRESDGERIGTAKALDGEDRQMQLFRSSVATADTAPPDDVDDDEDEDDDSGDE